MAHFELWKLAVDGLLVFSIIYLGYRFSRTGLQAGQTRKLESLGEKLHTLSAQATEVQKGFGAELRKTKSELEKLLYDLQTVEHRLNESITRAEATKGELAEAAKVARTHSSEIKQRAKNLQEIHPGARRVEEEQDMGAEEPLEPPSFETTDWRRNDMAETSSARRSKNERVNIYGEALSAGEHEPMAVPENHSLVDNIEREASPSSAGSLQLSPEANAKIQEIYAAAERMLRTGADLQLVEERTALPREEIQALARMLQSEDEAQRELEDEAEKVVREDDPRLGVMSPMRRTTQVV